MNYAEKINKFSRPISKIPQLYKGFARGAPIAVMANLPVFTAHRNQEG